MKAFFKKIAGLVEPRAAMVGSGESTATDNYDTSSVAVFDPTYLSDIASALTPERFAALMSSYLDHTKEKLVRIEMLLASNDLSQISAEAHALVGSAGNFGATQLSMVARSLEQASKREQRDIIPVLVADLRKASDRASAALDNWLKSRPDLV